MTFTDLAYHDRFCIEIIWVIHRIGDVPIGRRN